MGKTILIVEDDELNMKLFNDLLQADGYDTLQTRDGLEVVAIASEHKPDLILIDINLSNSSGLEITRQIKRNETLGHIPVIAVTACAMNGDKQKIMEGGCDGYVSKPISISSFLETVATSLN